MSAGTFTQIHLHIVFAVKHRVAVLDAAWRPRLFEYIAGVIEHPDHNHKLLAINGVEDHLHLALGLRPSQAISELVGTIKRASSRWINDSRLMRAGQFAWQEGYGAFSYSRSQLPDLIRYIENQEVHHAKEDFQTEYRRILDRFEVPYDERFLFKPPV